MGTYHRFAPEEKRFVRDNISGKSDAEMTELFNRRFGLSLSKSKIRGLIKREKTYSGKYPRRYTPEETLFIKENHSGRSYAEMTELFNRRFGLSLPKRAIADKINYGGYPGARKMGPVPIGKERIGRLGYVEVKTGPRKKDWKSKCKVIWEAANGPIPEGHRVIFADGDKSNFDPDNLLLVSLQELGLMNLHGLRAPDKALTKAGKIVANIKLLIRERSGTSRKKRKKKEAEA
jgi:hypothetical protein